MAVSQAVALQLCIWLSKVVYIIMLKQRLTWQKCRRLQRETDRNKVPCYSISSILVITSTTVESLTVCDVGLRLFPLSVLHFSSRLRHSPFPQAISHIEHNPRASSKPQPNSLKHNRSRTHNADILALHLQRRHPRLRSRVSRRLAPRIPQRRLPQSTARSGPHARLQALLQRPRPGHLSRCHNTAPWDRGAEMGLPAFATLDADGTARRTALAANL